MTRPARQGPDFDSHRRQAQAEDVAWLVEYAGLTLADACARVGVKPDTLEQRDRRAS